MKLWQKFTFLVIYTIFYFVIALAGTGGGHGNYYLLLPAVSWIFILPPIFFLGKLRSALFKILFLMFMTAHYLLLVILLLNYDFAEDRGMKFGPAWVPIAVYLFGQGIIWISFVNELMNPVEKDPPKPLTGLFNS